VAGAGPVAATNIRPSHPSGRFARRGKHPFCIARDISHDAFSVGAPSSICFGGEDTEREKSIMYLTLFGQNKHWVSKT